MKSYLVLVNHKKWLWWLSQACGVHVNRTQERGAGCFIKDPLELTCYKNMLLVLLDFFLFFFKKPYKLSVVSMVEEKQRLLFFLLCYLSISGFKKRTIPLPPSLSTPFPILFLELIVQKTRQFSTQRCEFGVCTFSSFLLSSTYSRALQNGPFRLVTYTEYCMVYFYS